MLLYKSGISQLLNNDDIIAQTRCKRSFSFAENTSYGLGGIAREAYFPVNLPQAAAVFDMLSESGARKAILGNGSNVLASDRPFNGAVLCTRYLCGIARINEETVFCLAGTKVSRLINYCVSHGLGGLEFLSGIPATVGGLAYMNGGADGKFMDSVVRSVKIYDGKSVNLSNRSCRFGVKRSAMQKTDCLIVGVFLSVKPSSPQEIGDKLYYYRARRAHLPKGRSCGCVFKNPPCVSAGKLIDEAGLKGRRVGGAYVSPVHANFIINDGGTARDVKTLIETVRREVYNRFGVLLEEEVAYIGDFNEING